MTRYDDETVITLLKDSVPALPEVGDRMDAVRRRAGHQRYRIATQTLGCLALIVAVGAGTVAVSRDGAGPSRDPQAAFASAAEAMAKQHTLRLEMTYEIAGRGDITLSGEFNLRAKTASFRATNLLGPGTVETRQVGGFRYTNGEVQELPPGKKWVRSPVDDEEGDGFVPDAKSMVDEILKNATRVTYLGQDRVRGVAAGKYRVERELAPRGEEPSDDVLADYPESTVWIDGHGLLRRFEATGQEQDGDDQMVSITLRLEFYDFGARVSVKAPPASEVVDQDDLHPPPSSVSPEDLTEVCEQAPPDKRAECLDDIGHVSGTTMEPSEASPSPK